ncbi:DUF883 C-terminal domain-containing protein [Xanthobacter sp. DSM 24535]|uniref:glycine zipper domain-containing protein n=1 Tax=Roseixanthobacter psychrophilus TaxID=3119917 RepID=UPI00372C6BC4
MADQPDATPGSPKAGVEPNLAEVRQDLEKLRADFAQLVETLGKTARHGVKGAAGEAELAAGEVTDWAEGQMATLRDSIQAQPLAACAIAAGVGALLGQLLVRR